MIEGENKILIILVLYKQKLEESKSFQFLKKNLAALSTPHKLVIYNNSTDFAVEQSEIEASIINPGENGMLAKAYNYALSIAKEEGYEWLMLLDQDSEPNEEYFKRVAENIDQIGENTAAIVPSVISNNINISPSEYSNGSGPFWNVRPIKGDIKENKYINAINSCSLLRVESILSIGGFNENYPLDYLDCWYFYQFHKKGYSIKIINATVHHNLSILSLEDMNIKRYEGYMKSCARFAKDTQCSFLFFFRMRTLLRCTKMLVLPSRWHLIRPTFSALFLKD